VNKQEAIRHIEATKQTVQEGQRFVVDRFRPEDAWGVARLFHAVYGGDYPIDTYYIPEKLIEQNRNGNLHIVVARTAEGDIVAHGALYRSSAHYQRVYESGLGLTLPSYRNSFVFLSIFRYVMEQLPKEVEVDEIFGEAVCYHVTVQKLAFFTGTKSIGLEIDLIPAAAYGREGATTDRVSCLLESKPYRDRKQKLYIPRVYSREMDFICSDLLFERTKNDSTGSPPPGSKTCLTHQFFGFADVARFNVVSLGEDFAGVAANMESEARASGGKVIQFFLNLGERWVGTGVEILRDGGYFLGGLLPRWFDSDGLLMQKLIFQPDFTGIRLFTDKAKALLEMVQKDWERTVNR
jgi:hypothetical protein